MIRKRSFCLTALLLLSLLPGFVALRAGEATPPAPPVPTPAPVVREQRVFVPFDKSDGVQGAGRGVFIPYEQFLKLTQSSQPEVKNPEQEKPPAEAVVLQASLKGEVHDLVARLHGEFSVRALKERWAKLPLALKNVALEAVELSDPQAVLAPSEGGEGYQLLLPKAGDYTLKITFSARVESRPGWRQFAFGLPPGSGTKLELTLPGKDLRVELAPKSAVVKTEGVRLADPNANPAPNEGEFTKLTAFLGRAPEVAISWMPPDSLAEKVRGEVLLTATQGMRVELGERVLRLQAQTLLNIERGEADAFQYKLPANWRLLSVKGDNIRDWNNENGRLTVRLHSPVKGAYTLGLRFEQILEKAPEQLELEFPAVQGALREDGYLAVVHEPGLRLKPVKTQGLMQVDVKDLPAGLNEGEIFAAYRYPSPPLALGLSVERVQPQLSAQTTAILDLGTDEDLLIGNVDFRVEKAGIFSAQLKVPARWEPAAIGAQDQLEDFQTAVEGDFKIITANFKSKVLGAFQLPFRFTAAGQGREGAITAVPVQVLGVKQDKGLLGIAAPKTLKLTSGARDKMSSANVQTLLPGGLPAKLPTDHDLPLAFQYTQTPATVAVTLEIRQTEIRATGFHALTVSEAGVDHLHKIEFLIQFAAADKVSFSAPAVLDEKIQAVCPGLKEKRKAGTKNGRTTWELWLQEKTLGVVPVTLTFQENFGGLEPEKPRDVEIAEIRAEDVKAQQGFLAVRKESALELAPEKPVGLEPMEAVNLPAEMRNANVYLAYRYFQLERKLALKLTSHVPVQTASTVVDLARLTYVLSEEKRLFVKAELWVSNAKGDQYLELGLPAEAAIRYLAVNGAQAAPLKNKEGHTLVKLPAGGAPLPVQLIYGLTLGTEGSSMGRSGSLEFPALGVFGQVPVGKTEAALYLPEEFAYWGFSNDYRLRASTDNISNALARVQAAVRGGVAGRNTEETSAGGAAPAILGAFQTQGKLFELETLGLGSAPRLSYCQRKVYFLIGLCAFVLVLGIGFVSAKKLKNASPLGWICLGLMLLPLILSWFAEGDAGEPYTAAFLGGALLCVVAACRQVLSLRRARQDAVLDAAPDPFIEEALPRESRQKQRIEEGKQGQTEEQDTSEKSEEPNTSKNAGENVAPPQNTSEDGDENKKGGA